MPPASQTGHVLCAWNGAPRCSLAWPLLLHPLIVGVTDLAPRMHTVCLALFQAWGPGVIKARALFLLHLPSNEPGSTFIPILQLEDIELWKLPKALELANGGEERAGIHWLGGVRDVPKVTQQEGQRTQMFHVPLRYRLLPFF